MEIATNPLDAGTEASGPLQDLSNIDPVQNQPNKRLRLSQLLDNEPRSYLDSVVMPKRSCF